MYIHPVLIQVCEDCRILLWAVEAPQINIIQSKFTASVKMAESHTVLSMEAIVEELSGLNSSMADMITSSDSIQHVSSGDLDKDSVDKKKMSTLYSTYATSQDATKFYVTFNKTKALKNLAEKFFKEAEDLFSKVHSKTLCPDAFSSVSKCKESLAQLECSMQPARRAIANLTCLTSLYRPLQTGETRNLLANKCLKGCMQMRLKPQQAFFSALAQHATPDLFQSFKNQFNAEKPKGS